VSFLLGDGWSLPTRRAHPTHEKQHTHTHTTVSAPRPRATAPDPDAGYLGVLYPADDCVVYGAAGPTGVKVVLVAADPQPADDALRGAAGRVAAAYGAAAANPFYTPGTPVTSVAFADRVREIVEGV